MTWPSMAISATCQTKTITARNLIRNAADRNYLARLKFVINIIQTRPTNEAYFSTIMVLCPSELTAVPGHQSDLSARAAENVPMTAEQAALLRQLALDAYELDACGPRLTQAEAKRRIATLAAKLKLLDGPPHTL